MKTIEIVPGPELDEAVRRACGLTGKTVQIVTVAGKSQTVCVLDGKGKWSPSTDLNAAFEAAEKVWPGKTELRFDKCNGTWWVHGFDKNSNPVALAEREETLAVAICRAILAAILKHAEAANA